MQLRQVVRDLWRAAAARARSPPALRRQLAPPRAPGRGKPVLPRFDEWAPLQRLDGDEASRLLAAEAAGAGAFFEGSEAFESRLQAEAAHLLEPQPAAPSEVHGDYRYFERYTPEGFLVFCRTRLAGEGAGAEEVLLDTGELAGREGSGYAEVTACKTSDDHAVVAYVVDLRGDESWELRFRTAGSREDWPACFPGVRSFEFLGFGDELSGLGVLAVYADAQTHRASSIALLCVARHGVAEKERRVLWEESDEAAYLEVFRTKDREFVLCSSNTKDTSEVRAVRCRGDAGQVRATTMLERREGVEYFAEHQGDRFLVISNHERPDFAVYVLTAAALGSEGGWDALQRFYTPPGSLHVTDADVLRRWLVLYGHKDAAPAMCVVPLHLPDTPQAAPAAPYLASLPRSVGAVEPGVNAEPSAESVRFCFRSPLDPGSTYDLQLATGELEMVESRRWQMPAGSVGPDAFECERLELPARDGELVPLTLARPRPEHGTAPRPCLLHVYGAYGTCLAPDFRPETVALLRRGWAVAWAHVRGGGERGRAWHSAARRLDKARSVTDLADAVRFLLARGIAAPGALCLKGSSAGGLPVGALLNSPREAPLVAAAVMEVPFVDVLTGMMDQSLPLTVHEFAEWGDPRQPEHEANLRSLSPYENVGSHQYPPLYLSCAREDARVPAWMPLKLAARLRARAPNYVDGAAGGSGLRRRRAPSSEGGSGAAAQGARGVVLSCTDGGHGGAVDWHGRTVEASRQIAFLYKALGLPLQ